MDGNSSIDINGLMAVNVLVHNGADYVSYISREIMFNAFGHK